jgi:hypothetical protein
LVGLGIILGSTSPTPIDGFLVGVAAVIFGFVAVIMAREFKQ